MTKNNRPMIRGACPECGRKYSISDLIGEEIQGSFYEQELQKKKSEI